MFYSNIEQLCSAKGIRISNLCDILHISRGNIARWKNGTVPTAEKLKLIADYFGVTTDYLLTGSDNKKSPAVKAEDKVPDDFILLARKTESIPPEKRKQLYMFLDSTIDTFLEALKDEKGNKSK